MGSPATANEVAVNLADLCTATKWLRLLGTPEAALLADKFEGTIAAQLQPDSNGEPALPGQLMLFELAQEGGK